MGGGNDPLANLMEFSFKNEDSGRSSSRRQVPQIPLIFMEQNSIKMREEEIPELASFIKVKQDYVAT